MLLNFLHSKFKHIKLPLCTSECTPIGSKFASMGAVQSRTSPVLSYPTTVARGSSRFLWVPALGCQGVQGLVSIFMGQGRVVPAAVQLPPSSMEIGTCSNVHVVERQLLSSQDSSPYPAEISMGFNLHVAGRQHPA